MGARRLLTGAQMYTVLFEDTASHAQGWHLDGCKQVLLLVSDYARIGKGSGTANA